jgi:two-component system, sensor histidine kinase
MMSIPPELARSALDAAPDAMIMIDDSGTICYANRQVAALFGYAHDDVIGRPVEVLMPERFRNRHVDHRNRFVANLRVRPMGQGLELYGRRADGTEFPLEISLSPIAGGARSLVAAAIRDVTDRKRVAAELNAQLEDMRLLHDLSTRLIGAADLPRLLEEILDATIAVQRADFGNIQLRDPASSALKIVAQRGFSPAFLEHFATVERGDESACGRALRAGGRVIIEDIEQDPEYLPHRAIAAHEGYRAVQSTPISGRDGAVMGVLSTHFRTPHRPSDRELQLTDLYLRLVAELIARVQDEEIVRAARDLAQRMSRSKSRFLATASHDLRQPLQTLALLNGALRRIAEGQDTMEMLLQEEQAISAMSRLLNALLDISKLESGAVKPEPRDFAVAGLFAELHGDFAGMAESKGLRLEIEARANSVHSDPSLVAQMLRNLVANAIKYTQQGLVRLSCSATEDSKIRIEVLDTGIGIPTDQLSSIFEEFYQVGVPANSSRDGYGLGLSIVQRIAALLEIKLDVRSEVGKGSSFSLLLPPASASVAEAAPPRMAPLTHARRAGYARVLLVEDDAAVRDATRMLFSIEGYRVTAVASLDEALRSACNGEAPDLLVTDYHLRAGETGTQVISAVRDALRAPLRSVLITGDTSSAIAELPRDAYLRIASKPIDAEELLTMVKEFLGSGWHSPEADQHAQA